MEVALGPIIGVLLKMGAPWVITAVFIVLFLAERKRKDQLSDKLYDLGMAQVEKDVEVHHTLIEVRKDMEDIKRLTASVR